MATFIFVFINSGHEYQCALPGGGYFMIRWNKETNKIDLIRWRQKNKSSPKKPAKNLIRIHAEDKL